VGERFDLLRNAGVIFLVESNDNVFEMSEYALLIYLNLSSSFALCAFEAKVAVGTNKVIYPLRRDGVQVENLPTLQVLKLGTGD
jgi:hypothetical protein